MKLELKHISPYLPYNLKMWWLQCRISLTLTALSNEYESYYCRFNDDSKTAFKRSSLTPILRPLSDLTKEININGVIIRPDKVLRELLGDEICYREDYNDFVIDFKLAKYNIYPLTILQMYEKLFEWHFDVFELIEKGLAIDINNIKT